MLVIIEGGSHIQEASEHLMEGPSQALITREAIVSNIGCAGQKINDNIRDKKETAKAQKKQLVA